MDSWEPVYIRTSFRCIRIWERVRERTLNRDVKAAQCIDDAYEAVETDTGVVVYPNAEVVLNGGPHESKASSWIRAAFAVAVGCVDLVEPVRRNPRIEIARN